MSLLFLLRHPELVSGSTSPIAQSVIGEPWMLKRVQHDGYGNSLGDFEPSSGDGPLGEKFVRREMDLTQRINGTPVEDTTKEFVIEKKQNAKN